MGVYINGFPLPNNCGACPLRLAWCRERIYILNRPDRCPLVPVKPHGRLIDADAFEDFIRKDWDKNDHWIADVVYSRPAIIPAEEGE